MVCIKPFCRRLCTAVLAGLVLFAGPANAANPTDEADQQEITPNESQSSKEASGAEPVEALRVAALKTLAAVDEAAKNQDAAGIVAHVSRDADIQVRLAGASTWTTLSRSELKILWADTFDSAEQYDYARSEPQTVAEDGDILAFSRINERFSSGADTRVLEIHENAVLEMTDDRAVIRKLELDIRDPSR